MSATQIAGQITSPTDISAVQAQGSTISTSVTLPVSPSKFTFWAGFDGTNNIASNPAYSGDIQNTAVGSLWGQIDRAQKATSNANVGVGYYAGVGTPGTALGSSVFPTQQAIATAQLAYNDFAEQANTWLQKNPGGSVTTMLASFSRGSIAAAVFSQMLYENGLVFQGTMLVPPGQVGVSAGLIISPVNTGGNGDVAFAPNAQNMVEIVAANEYRIAYEQDIYSGMTQINLSGNHGDVGGFYPGGLGSIYLQNYTDFFNAANPGMAANVLPTRQYAGGPLDIHVEAVVGPDTLQNLPGGSYAAGSKIGTSTISSLGSSEVTATGDVLKFVNYKGETVVMERVGGVIQSITRTPSNQVGGPSGLEYKISTPTNTVATTNPDGSSTVIAQNAAGITLQSTKTLASGEIVQTNYTSGSPASVTRTTVAGDGTKTVSLYDATGNILQATVATSVVNNGTGIITTSEIAQNAAGVVTRVVETVQNTVTKTSTTTQMNLNNGTVTGKTVTAVDAVSGAVTQDVFDTNNVQISNVVKFASGEVDKTSYVGGIATNVTKQLQDVATGTTTVYVFDGTGINLQLATLTESNVSVDPVTGGKVFTVSQTKMDGTGAMISTEVLSQTVDAQINGQAVNVTYTKDANGNPIAHVNSINGQPPLNPQEVDAAFQNTNPEQLVNGTAGTDIGGAVSVNDAVHPTGLQSLTKALTTIIDTLAFIKAIQTGQPLPVVASGLRLANTLTGNTSYSLGGAANAASGVLSLMSLDAALKRGDSMAAITAGAQAISYSASAYASFGGTFSSTTASSINSLNTALPYLNIVNSIVHGDAVGAAMAAISMTPAAPVAWAYYAFNMIDSLFSSSEAPPEAWGSAHAQRTGFTASSSAVGQFGGLEAASQTYNGVLSYLEQLAAQQQTLNPGSSIGVIANRLPGLSYRNYSGYQITDIDPLTGVQRNPDTKYDLTGHSYNAPAGSPESFLPLGQAFIASAIARGAIAPQWEVQTADCEAANDAVFDVNDECFYERRAA